jgi:hypothetical protein
MDTRKRIEEAGRLSLAANKRFTSENRELLASFDQDSLWKGVLAFIQLESRSEIEQAAPSVDFYLGVIRRAFLSLLDEGSIEPIFPITTLGQQALDEMRRATGIGVESLPALVVELTPEQTLDEQIVVDWNTLSSAQIRKKRDSSKTYAAALSRLLETDRLSPHATVKVAY